MLQPPMFASIELYGARLGDADHWRPYAEAALMKSGLPEQPMSSGFEGTYPTLVGLQLVVKLFGYFPGWRESLAAELAANHAVEKIDGVTAPRIVATGSLFPGRDEDWPFLIMERLDGRAWREAALETSAAEAIASQLGSQIRRLHDSAPNDLILGRPDWVVEHGRDAPARHRSWGSLPQHLIDEMPAYLANYRAERRCLVHGDLTEDHLFVSGSVLLGVIDWGDAMVSDPFYELGALHLGAFAGDRRLLGRFLTAYGWGLDQRFVDHALQVALMHRFDLFGAFSALSRGSRTLAAMARELWTPII